MSIRLLPLPAILVDFPLTLALSLRWGEGTERIPL